MKNKIQYILVGLTMLSIASCKTNLKEEAISTGNANFTRYVAVGNSLTSGYSDGALSRSGQMNSYPKMLSEQFQLVSSGTFNIPYMDSYGGGSDVFGNPRYVLGYKTACNSSVSSLSPVYDPNGATPFGNVSAQGPFNLIGVPGIKAIDCNNPAYLNPFFIRFCQTPGTSTLISEAMRANPTFFSLWLGSNDVLLFATQGADLSSGNFLSNPDSVSKNLEIALNNLTSLGAKGVIANIPNVTSIPYFTTIPWNAAVLTQSQANDLNLIYAQIDSNIKWQAGANGLIIVDSTKPSYMRHATANDYILLTTPGDSLTCGQWGVNPLKPLKNKYVLDANESNEIQTYINSYNSIIAGLASKYNLAHVDINSYFKTFVSGIKYNGVNMNAKFITGGAFSLDGVHPNARGYALIANEFIKSINLKFGSTIPQVDAIKYNGIIFP